MDKLLRGIVNSYEDFEDKVTELLEEAMDKAFTKRFGRELGDDECVGVRMFTNDYGQMVYTYGDDVFLLADLPRAEGENIVVDYSVPQNLKVAEDGDKIFFKNGNRG